MEQGKWIPVEDRLPSFEEWKRAYCQNVHGSEFLVMIDGATHPTTLFFQHGSWMDIEGNFFKVVAWMNMPESYQKNEVIEKAKKHLFEATNFRASKEMMSVLDKFLFRCWQLGWLDQYDETKKKEWIPTTERLPEEKGLYLFTIDSRIPF